MSEVSLMSSLLIKQAYSQNIFKNWNHFLNISKFGCCEMVKMKQIKQIYVMYCFKDVFCKIKQHFEVH